MRWEGTTDHSFPGGYVNGSPFIPSIIFGCKSGISWEGGIPRHMDLALLFAWVSCSGPHLFPCVCSYSFLSMLSMAGVLGLFMFFSFLLLSLW